MPDAQNDREIPVARRRRSEVPDYLAPAPVDAGIFFRPDRPRIVGLVGWITAALGYANFVIKGGGIVRYFSDMKWLNPDYVAPVLTRNQYAAEVTLTLAEIGLGLLAIAAGLGALKLREWGRRLLIYYAIASLVEWLLKSIYLFATFDQTLEATIRAATQPIDRSSVENHQYFVLLTFTAASAVWPLIVWSVATRRYVRAAFARAEGRPLPDDAGGDDWAAAR